MKESAHPWGWTEARRAAQAAAIRRSQPWTRSTGPRSAEGKAVSARNAAKPNSIHKQLAAIAAELREVRRQVNRIGSARRAVKRRS